MTSCVTSCDHEALLNEIHVQYAVGCNASLRTICLVLTIPFAALLGLAVVLGA